MSYTPNNISLNRDSTTEGLTLTLVKLPKMNAAEIDQLVEEQSLCRIAFKGPEYPYIAPFQYVCMNNTLYFHFTDYGRKMSLLEKDDRVCVEIECYTKDLSRYQFVVLSGKLTVVTDSRERAKVARKMGEEGERKLSRNFLAAHGLKPEQGWPSLSQQKSFVIVKLGQVTERLGLKSP
jgi:nitroimidazol reductase NimA-like FMN-containing flavoprotein (pyridoxamine 5'-phosphate oxidase superfamily)